MSTTDVRVAIVVLVVLAATVPSPAFGVSAGARPRQAGRNGGSAADAVREQAGVSADVALMQAGAKAGSQATGQTTGQAKRPVRKPAAPPAPMKTEAAEFQCPSLLGEGVQTKRSFCDVLTSRDVADGIIISLPPHAGPVTLTFDLHNRHTYSEELIKTNRAYRRYTATIGVLTADNTLLSRAVVQNDFRTAADLVDRVAGGAGPGGVKAVAPTGSEAIRITIPEAEQSVSILGEKLSVIRADGTDNFSAPGRPIAIISNVMLEYRPAPARRPSTPAPKRR